MLPGRLIVVLVLGDLRKLVLSESLSGSVSVVDNEDVSLMQTSMLVSRGGQRSVGQGGSSSEARWHKGDPLGVASALSDSLFQAENLEQSSSSDAESSSGDTIALFQTHVQVERRGGCSSKGGDQDDYESDESVI